jgi:C4-dicarboxylate-specific signal transduction histidine kinase
LQGVAARGEQVRLERSDGSVEYLRWLLTPWFDQHQRVLGLILVTHPITSQVEQNDQLFEQLNQARLESEQASKLATIGGMASSIAHELNNPLQIIDSYLYMLRADLAEGDIGQLEESLAAMDRAVKRASQIVMGLRKFAPHDQIEESTETSVQDLVQESIALCEARFRAHGVKLEASVSTSRFLRGDPAAYSQILVHLLNNAFDAVITKPHTQRRVQLRAHSDQEDVIIEVLDSGDGVDQELAETIFESFFTTKTPTLGKGLGLSIARGLAERMGGELEVIPADSGGRFVLRLAFVQGS